MNRGSRVTRTKGRRTVYPEERVKGDRTPVLPGTTPARLQRVEVKRVVGEKSIKIVELNGTITKSPQKYREKTKSVNDQTGNLI